jgi:hypothetical protein
MDTACHVDGPEEGKEEEEEAVVASTASESVGVLPPKSSSHVRHQSSR